MLRIRFTARDWAKALPVLEDQEAGANPDERRSRER
jgi:hypothetical protein